MGEQHMREVLPRFRGDYPVAIVKNVNRIEGVLPPLMDDVRATNLMEYKPPGNGVTVYLKAVGSPYTGENGIHFLTIPDRSDHSNIPGIADLSASELAHVLKFVESVSHSAFSQPGISEVDFGWHHSRAELQGIPKQRLATFPQNLHIHTIAFASEDMKAVSKDEVIANADLTGKTGEALHMLGEELFFKEIVPALQEEYPDFNSIFEETKDTRGRRRFKIRGGSKSFDNILLAQILQAIDVKGKQAYDALARCFFEFNEESGQFKVKDDQYARFKLLPCLEREIRVAGYVIGKPNLSEGVKLGLRWLAQHAQDEHIIIERELEKAENKKGADLTEEERDNTIKEAANRFWAYKDFSYSMSFSAQKTEEGQNMEWIFAFDPKIFSVEGIVQSSAFTDKWIVRDTGKAYTAEQLQAVQAKERAVIDLVIKENPEYKIGPGIALGA